jgi:hypothetical protein
MNKTQKQLSPRQHSAARKTAKRNATAKPLRSLLVECQDRVITLSADRGGSLGVEGPAFQLDADLLSDLKSRKPQILAILAEAPDPTVDVPGAPCPTCPSRVYRDYPTHGGLSTRRDCAECGRTLGFPRWYGEPRELPGV